VLVVVAYLVFKPRAVRRREARSRALPEIRRLLWGDEPRESAFDLLERNRILFIGVELGWEQRLDHRLEDAGGTEIGSSLQQPRPGRLSPRNGRPSRFTTVRVEIRDENQVKQLEIVRPSGIRTQPLEIFDGSELVSERLRATAGARSRYWTHQERGSGQSSGEVADTRSTTHCWMHVTWMSASSPTFRI
jgi:hypothetical protein